MQLRLKLVPYLYTAARVAFDTGVSVCSPLYYHWPFEDAAYEFKTQYMFGDMLAAPVTKPMVKALSLVKNFPVWIPEGEWIGWFNGQVRRARCAGTLQWPARALADVLTRVFVCLRVCRCTPDLKLSTARSLCVKLACLRAWCCVGLGEVVCGAFVYPL